MISVLSPNSYEDLVVHHVGYNTSQTVLSIILLSFSVGSPAGRSQAARKSVVITRIRTGRIGQAAFLNKAPVPDFRSPACQCGHDCISCYRILQPVQRGSPMVSGSAIRSHGHQIAGGDPQGGALQTSQVVHTAAHPPTVYLAKELLYGEDNEAQVNWAAGQLPS